MGHPMVRRIVMTLEMPSVSRENTFFIRFFDLRILIKLILCF